MNIEPIAIYSGGITVYWSSIIIALGIVAGFLLANSLYTANSDRRVALWCFLPFAIVLSLLFCRVLHWYCHEEQYASFLSAMTDYSTGSYCLPGALLGVYLAAVITEALGCTRSKGRLLDAVAPGLALTIAMIRLSSLFNSTCHSKLSIEKKLFQRLPFGTLFVDASGKEDWRFATFFVEFILMLIVMAVLIGLYIRLHNCRMKSPCSRSGNIFRLFLVLYGAITLVLDSTRNDSSFLHFPLFLKFLDKFAGFVSFAQLVAAVSILCVLIYYSKCAKSAGDGSGNKLIWVLYFISLALVGGCEYCVQRWSNLFRLCYFGQTIGAILMAAAVIMMYRRCMESTPEIETE